MTNTYLFKFSVEWFNIDLEKTITNWGVVPASSHAKAVAAIEKRFPNIEKISISNTCDKFLFFESEEEMNTITENI